MSVILFTEYTALTHTGVKVKTNFTVKHRDFVWVSSKSKHFDIELSVTMFPESFK